MLFDSKSGAAERKMVVIAGLMFIVWLCLVGGIVYAALHFIIKFW